VELRRGTAADVDRKTAAAALDAVFAEYLVPISFSEPIYAVHVKANDVVAEQSPIWYDADGNVVAAALLGVRGKRGWIGGFGVIPEQRKKGLGHALLDEILERSRAIGLESVVLEVLLANVGARRTYEAGGFIVTRRLSTFGVDVHQPVPEVRDVPYADALAFLDDAAGEVRPCWQREDVGLRRQHNLHAVGAGNAYAVFNHNGERAQILKVHAPAADVFARLTGAIAAQTGVVRMDHFHEPADSAIADAARSLGWLVGHESYEMLLEFSAPNFRRES
jgi:ribosomal protein S18 acetylase RimI-like enzyme